jgi:hypothetical protein
MSRLASAKLVAVLDYRASVRNFLLRRRITVAISAINIYPQPRLGRL